MALRCHEWSLVETCELSGRQLPQPGELPVPLSTLVREAARLWCQQSGEKVGDFRTHRLSPLDTTRTVAQCFRHEDCETFFQFTGRWDAQEKYCLVVRKSGPTKYH